MLNPRDKYTQMIYFMLVDRFNSNIDNDFQQMIKRFMKKQTTLEGTWKAIFKKLKKAILVPSKYSVAYQLLKTHIMQKLSTQLHIESTPLPWILAYFMYLSTLDLAQVRFKNFS